MLAPVLALALLAAPGAFADGQPASAAASAPAGTQAAAAPLNATPVQDLPAAQATPPAPSIGVAPGSPAPSSVGAPVTMPTGSATGSLLQTLFALTAVLALLAALAWFLKRYGPKPGGGTAKLRIVGSLNLGGRERLLVVEVGSQWIVVGASPGRVNALATMPRQDNEEAGADGGTGSATLAQAGSAPSATSFADWLKQTIDKRK